MKLLNILLLTTLTTNSMLSAPLNDVTESERYTFLMEYIIDGDKSPDDMKALTCACYTEEFIKKMSGFSIKERREWAYSDLKEKFAAHASTLLFSFVPYFEECMNAIDNPQTDFNEWNNDDKKLLAAIDLANAVKHAVNNALFADREQMENVRSKITAISNKLPIHFIYKIENIAKFMKEMKAQQAA